MWPRSDRLITSRSGEWGSVGQSTNPTTGGQTSTSTYTYYIYCFICHPNNCIFFYNRSIFNECSRSCSYSDYILVVVVVLILLFCVFVALRGKHATENNRVLVADVSRASSPEIPNILLPGVIFREIIDAAEPVNESVGCWALERAMVGGGGGGGAGLDRGARGVPRDDILITKTLITKYLSFVADKYIQ